MIALSIDASGALTAVPGSPFASVALDAERVANELAVDPSGKFLYVRNIGSPGSMAVFSIAAGGTLGAGTTRAGDSGTASSVFPCSITRRMPVVTFFLSVTCAPPAGMPLTDVCNLHCRHCYLGAGKGAELELSVRPQDYSRYQFVGYDRLESDAEIIGLRNEDRVSYVVLVPNGFGFTSIRAGTGAGVGFTHSAMPTGPAIVAFAATPSASVTIAAAANPGDRRSRRHAYRTSFPMPFHADPLASGGGITADVRGRSARARRWR